MIRTIFLAVVLALTATAPAFADWAIFTTPKSELFVGRYYSSVSDAKRNVKAQCERTGNTCTFLVGGFRQCVAVMHTANGKLAFAKGNNQSGADRDATKACDALKDGPCTMQHQFCFG
jgi:hypothetical protein